MQIIIAGPCAAESEEQIKLSIKQAKRRKIKILRSPLWKPRTRPGFDGLGEDGLKILLDIKKEGLVPATEVVTPKHAQLIINTFPESKVVVWIGSRNQNHFVQKEIANIVSLNKNALLIIKNPPWPDENHWLGAVEHIRKTKIKKNKLLLCHRGFFPSKENSSSYRNFPDCEMAMRIKKKTGLPMLIDPSHIGGSVSNVFQILKEKNKYQFDGVIIEVHPYPSNALTDANQQLSWNDFDLIENLLK